MIISIENYSVAVKLGHFDYEHLALQDLRVSLTAQLGYCARDSERDDLEKTLDYGSLLQLVDKTIAGKEFRLIERIVGELGTTIMESYAQIEALKVNVEKTRLPRKITKDASINVYRIFLRSSEVKLCW